MHTKKIIVVLAAFFMATLPHSSRAEDSRVIAMSTLGALATVSGIYVLCKKTESTTHSIAKTASGLTLISLGLGGIFFGKELLAQLDTTLRQSRWKNRDFRLSDLNPRNW